jgi:hypothetical protein
VVESGYCVGEFSLSSSNQSRSNIEAFLRDNILFTRKMQKKSKLWHIRLYMSFFFCTFAAKLYILQMKTNQPLFSVLIANYNNGKYLMDAKEKMDND